MDIEISFDYTGEEYKEILRCLKTLYTTPVGTCALDRNLGIDMSILDEPTNVAQSLFSVEIIKKTDLYEPRVRVKEVKYTVQEGRLKPEVVIERV